MTGTATPVELGARSSLESEGALERAAIIVSASLSIELAAAMAPDLFDSVGAVGGRERASPA